LPKPRAEADGDEEGQKAEAYQEGLGPDQSQEPGKGAPPYREQDGKDAQRTVEIGAGEVANVHKGDATAEPGFAQDEADAGYRSVGRSGGITGGRAVKRTATPS
jgi:hypothetical protein